MEFRQHRRQAGHEHSFGAQRADGYIGGRRRTGLTWRDSGSVRSVSSHVDEIRAIPKAEESTPVDLAPLLTNRDVLSPVVETETGIVSNRPVAGGGK